MLRSARDEEFVIYAAEKCHWTKQIIDLLTVNGLTFDENYLSDPGAQALFFKHHYFKPSERDLPKVYVFTGETLFCIGGFSELHTYLNRPLLKAA